MRTLIISIFVLASSCVFAFDAKNYAESSKKVCLKAFECNKDKMLAAVKAKPEMKPMIDQMMKQYKAKCSSVGADGIIPSVKFDDKDDKKQAKLAVRCMKEMESKDCDYYNGKKNPESIPACSSLIKHQKNT